MKQYSYSNDDQGNATNSPTGRVLLLGRNEDIRQQIIKLLELWDIGYVARENVIRAFSTLVAAASDGPPFDAVIVDGPSFATDPLQFAQALNEDEYLGETALIYLTAPLPRARRETLIESGFSRILNLPLDQRALYNALHVKHSGNETNSAVVDIFSRRRPISKTRRLEILIGEGDRINQQRMSRMLQGAGHRTFLIEEGSEVLDALDNHSFDLVILSNELPGISGLDTFKLFRFAHPEQDRPAFIILVDNDDTTQAMTNCREAGADACLAKPLSAEALMETVESLVGNATGDEPENSQIALDSSGRTPLLDYKRLSELQKLGSFDGFLVQLINDFHEETERLLSKMESAIEENHPEDFRNLGQLLRENAGNLGVMSLYRLGNRAIALEDLDFRVEARRIVADIRHCHTFTRKALEEFLSGPVALSPGKDP